MADRRDNPSPSAQKLEKLIIGQTTTLRLLVWRLRRFVRDRHPASRDVLDVEAPGKVTGKAVRKVYRSVDGFMAHFFPGVVKTTPREVAVQRLKDMINELDYTIVDEDVHKPWGAFFRMADKEAERFIHEFFPGLSLREAMLDHDNVVLSPKFLLVAPGQRLSWQFHHRRAERWRFLSDGKYHISDNDDLSKPIHARAGSIVQFATGQRHRLCAADENAYTLVAEIWQHTDPGHPSEEADIVRLADDYQR
ncbi:MAG TPA: hypothetical protein VF597_02080 [Candidatus Saccharimonadales bacterium]|jgi:mannose-6-phosphate isomerase-like protein (cupin superfamily)